LSRCHAPPLDFGVTRSHTALPKADFDFKRVLFLLFAGIAAFGMAKRFGES
jgi:hypothetical protein